jgi:23S rRNA (uracil1939-C5)-methyltransferase
MTDQTSEPRAGRQLRLEIEAVVSDGRGLARHEGRAVFVAGALPGQQVLATLVRVRERMAEATLDAVLAASPQARPEPCPHHAECGGCPWQALPYARQLEWKTRFVHDALRRIGRIAEPFVPPALPSPLEWRYRNKMEFAFGLDDGRNRTVGLRRRASRSIVGVTACLLQSERTMRVLARVRATACGRAPDVPWRYLVVREPAAGGCLIELIAGPHPAAAREGRRIGSDLLAACPDVDGVVVSERAAALDMAYGERILCALGQSVLEERIGPLRVRLGAGTFFQVNTRATALLYAEIRRLAGPGDRLRRIWDVYCGVGSIGLYLAAARECGTEPPHITAVDISRQAVELARHNARSLGVAASCRQAAADRILPVLLSGKKTPPPDLILLDPPRAGLSPGVVRALLRARPRRIVYVSCDPATLARDAAGLAPYALTEIRPVDMFPQTPHVECAALFEPK